MYRVEHFAVEDAHVLRRYLSENPFASLVVESPDGPSVDHLPLEFEPEPGGRLLGHVARSNPIWREADGSRALAVFSAHDAYVSPDWYVGKSADPRVVPTWNYVAVHVSGTLRFFHEPERIAGILERLTERFETPRATPWRIADAPSDFIEKLSTAVVGVELEIDRMIGKWKLSQNRPRADRDGVIAGLRRESDARGLELAELMEAFETDSG